MLQGAAQTQGRARSLRRKMTLPEVLLWQRLKLRPAGLKFRRQHPAGRYVLDFYCHEARLILEVDGMAHDGLRTAACDRERDALFAARGLQTLRISAAEVLRDADQVAESITTLALARR